MTAKFKSIKSIKFQIEYKDHEKVANVAYEQQEHETVTEIARKKLKKLSENIVTKKKKSPKYCINLTYPKTVSVQHQD